MDSSGANKERGVGWQATSATEFDSSTAADAKMRDSRSGAFCSFVAILSCQRNLLRNGSEKEPKAAKSVDIVRLGASGLPIMRKSVKAATLGIGYVNCKSKLSRLQRQPS
jgi:hypothetical protein